MKTKEIEGQEYILKTDVDELVRQRITKVSERARTAEEKVKEMSNIAATAQDSQAIIDGYQKQIAELQASMEKQKALYDSHSTIARYGFLDDDLRDMVEWSYNREMSGRSKKNQQKLGEWLEDIKANPEKAPVTLRPHLISANQSPSEVQTETITPDHRQTSTPPPKTQQSSGVVQPTEKISSSLIESALRDPEIYRARREEIKATWYAQRKKNRFG